MVSCGGFGFVRFGISDISRLHQSAVVSDLFCGFTNLTLLTRTSPMGTNSGSGCGVTWLPDRFMRFGLLVATIVGAISGGILVCGAPVLDASEIDRTSLRGMSSMSLTNMVGGSTYFNKNTVTAIRMSSPTMFLASFVEVPEVDRGSGLKADLELGLPANLELGLCHCSTFQTNLSVLDMVCYHDVARLEFDAAASKFFEPNPDSECDTIVLSNHPESGMGALQCFWPAHVAECYNIFVVNLEVKWRSVTDVSRYLRDDRSFGNGCSAWVGHGLALSLDSHFVVPSWCSGITSWWCSLISLSPVFVSPEVCLVLDSGMIYLFVFVLCLVIFTYDLGAGLSVIMVILVLYTKGALAADSSSSERYTCPSFSGVKHDWDAFIIAFSCFVAMRDFVCTPLLEGEEPEPNSGQPASGVMATPEQVLQQEAYAKWKGKNTKLYGYLVSRMPQHLALSLHVSFRYDGVRSYAYLKNHFGFVDKVDRASAMANISKSYFVSPEVCCRDLGIQFDKIMQGQSQLRSAGGQMLEDQLLQDFFVNAMPAQYKSLKHFLRGQTFSSVLDLYQAAHKFAKADELDAEHVGKVQAFKAVTIETDAMKIISLQKALSAAQADKSAGGKGKRRQGRCACSWRAWRRRRQQARGVCVF